MQGAEVEYSLRLIPLGGYVAFPEDQGNIDPNVGTFAARGGGGSWSSGKWGITQTGRKLGGIPSDKNLVPALCVDDARAS